MTNSVSAKLHNNYFLLLIVIAFVFFAAGKTSFELSQNDGFAEMIWPGAPIGFLFVLFFGYRVLPAIYVGALFSMQNNLIETFSDLSRFSILPYHLVIAAGAVAQAFIAVWAVRRLNLVDHDFITPKKTVLFYIVAGPICCLTSTTVATLAFYTFGISSFMDLLDEWLLWWISDSTSTILFVSVIFAVVKFDQNRLKAIIGFCAVGLMIALLISFVGKTWENEKLDLIFEQEVNTAVDTLGQYTSANIALTGNIRGFIDSHQNLKKEGLASFAQVNLSQNSNVRSVSWIEKVPHDELEQYEQELKRIHGDDRLKLWEMEPDGTVIDPKPAESYEIVKYVEPYDPYKIALGYVLNNDLNRSTAMKRAEKTGDIVITAPVILVTKPVGPSAATIYQAHFRDNVFEGYTAIIIQIDTMFQSLLDKTPGNSFYVDLYDKEEGPDLTFRSYDEQEVDTSALKSITVEFPILNRTWIIRFSRTQMFLDQNRTAQPMFIGIAGMLFAALVAVTIVVFSGQREYLEKQVSERTQELEKANRAKTEFMANMSHDLRTPLNAIIGFSEIMKQEMYGELGNKKYLEYTRDINKASEYLLSLINDILDFSAIDANKRNIEKENIDPVSLIDDCMRSLNPLIEAKRHKAEVKLPPDFPDIYADRRAMKQIFINLLSNAIKFTPEGGEITVHGHINKNYVFLSVSDTGEGIEEENIAKILDPFTRVENHPHLSQEGTGLGLAIVNALVKLHGGRLIIKSRIHEGTDVSIKLPR